MAIKGLGFDMMSAYNRIDNRSVSRDAVKETLPKPLPENTKSQEQDSREDFSGIKVNLNFDSIRRRSNADLESISKDFVKTNGLGIAIDDQIMKSDMDKAVADMEKDSSLKQYQYFIGDSSNIITNDEDGLVFIK